MLLMAGLCFFIRNRKKYRDIWLICERSAEARDNGIWLFKYIMDNKLHDNAWYIIEKDAFDYDRVEKYSNRLITYNSFKHYMYYCLCAKAISTHLPLCAPSPVGGRRLKNIMPVKKSFIYLGHGLQKDGVEFLFKKNSKIDLFIVNGINEYNDLITNAGYAENEVVVTGGPRYDGLHDTVTNKEILIMPTNRTWFYDKNFNKQHEVFLSDPFFREYQGLLDDPAFNQMVDQSGYKVLFYLHSRSQPFIDHFNTDNENIRIVNMEDMGVQEALKRAALLVTDFSSVAFDFAYMGKPVLYFQFDYERFRKDQYSEGWFSYSDDGVGDIVDNRDSLIQKINELLKADCLMSDEYIKRTEKIYTYHDQDNCERVFNSIIDID